MNVGRLFIAAMLVLTVGSVAQDKSKTTTTCLNNDPLITCETEDSDRSSADLGQAVGNAVGGTVMNARVNRGVKKYCKAHPGEPFHWTMPDGTIVRRGTCPGKVKN